MCFFQILKNIWNFICKIVNFPFKTPSGFNKISIFRLCVQIFMIVLVIFCLITYGQAIYNINIFNTTRFITSTNYIYDNHNTLINYTSYEHKKYLPIYKIPKKVIQSIIAVEDRSFYSNYGINLRSLPRAIIEFIPSIIKGKRPRGSSTITQQLARQLFFNQSISIIRKAKEFIYSILLSFMWSKDKIMELYINNAYFSSNIYGFQMAGKVFFGKNIDQLDTGEIAGLVGMLRAPVILSPRRNINNFYERKNVVLNAMVGRKIISIEEAVYYANKEIVIKEPINCYTDYISLEIKDFLIKNFGKSAYKKGGYKIYTTINSDLQKISQTVLEDVCFNLEREQPWKGKIKQLKKYNHNILCEIANQCGCLYIPIYIVNKEFNYKFGTIYGKLSQQDIEIYKKHYAKSTDPTGDILIINKNKKLLTNFPTVTGQITIMNQNGELEVSIGGVDFTRNQYCINTQSKRQIGSCMKIFDTLCAMEYLKILPSFYLKDVHSIVKNHNLVHVDKEDYYRLDRQFLRHNYAKTGIWVVRNWDGDFWGDINLRISMEHSRNIPFLDLILNHVGLDNFRKFLIKLQMWPKFQSIYPSVILGNLEMHPSDFARICCVLLNSGHIINHNILIKNITNKKTNIFESSQNFSIKPVLNKENIHMILSIMNGSVKRGNGFRLNTSKFSDNLHTKTGTTSDNKDALCVCLIHNKLLYISICKDNNLSLGANVLGAKYPVLCVKKILQYGEKYFINKPIIISNLPKTLSKKKVPYNVYNIKQIGFNKEIEEFFFNSEPEE